jgi:hypothetical protein
MYASRTQKGGLSSKCSGLLPNLYAYVVTKAGDFGISLCIAISVHETTQHRLILKMQVGRINISYKI